MKARSSILVAQWLGVGLILAALPASAQTTPPLTPDIPAKFAAPKESADYVKRVEMIPMRDGVKLYSVIVGPKGARTPPTTLPPPPYARPGPATRTASTNMISLLPQGDEVFVADGYI